MQESISHDRRQESPEAKARWFQSLSLAERMDYLCMITDLALENDPHITDLRDSKWASKRVQILTLP